MSEIMDNHVNEAFQTELAADDLLKRCVICGFIVDTKYAAEKPAIDFSMAGRSKRSDEVRAPPMTAPAQGQAELLCRAQFERLSDFLALRGEAMAVAKAAPDGLPSTAIIRLLATIRAGFDALDRLAKVEQERDHWFDDAIADRRQRKRAEAQIVRLREALTIVEVLDSIRRDPAVHRLVLAALAHPSKPGDG